IIPGTVALNKGSSHAWVKYYQSISRVFQTDIVNRHDWREYVDWEAYLEFPNRPPNRRNWREYVDWETYSEIPNRPPKRRNWREYVDLGGPFGMAVKSRLGLTCCEGIPWARGSVSIVFGQVIPGKPKALQSLLPLVLVVSRGDRV